MTTKGKTVCNLMDTFSPDIDQIDDTTHGTFQEALDNVVTVTVLEVEWAGAADRDT